MGNLIALRELALRELADDVDERLELQSSARTLRGPWRREESVFVCVSSDRHAERLIRRGFRMAYRLKASWHVHHVHIGTGMVMAPEVKEHLAGLERLTVRLGGIFISIKVQSCGRYQVFWMQRPRKRRQHNWWWGRRNEYGG